MKVNPAFTTKTNCADDNKLTVLKWLAILTMIFDHAIVGVSQHMFLGDWYPYLRAPGRISIPIFSWLIAYNMTHHTRNPTKYAIRLSIMAIICEPIFQLYFRVPGNAFTPLAIAAAIIAAEKNNRIRPIGRYTTYIGMILATCVWTIYCNDFGVAAQVLLTLICYRIIRKPNLRWILYASITACLINGICWQFSTMILFTAALIWWTYKPPTHKLKIRRVNKWVWYLFYPVHILMLYAIFQ